MGDIMKFVKIIFILIILIAISACSIDYRDGDQYFQSVDHYNLDSFPLEDVSETEEQALIDAINDEYKAKAVYQKVLEKHGQVRPFSNIINAEQQHIDSLELLFERYDLEVPEDTLYDKVPEFETVKEACEAGVQAEIDNAALYDRLFAEVDNQDITFVFQNLRDASEKSHLPAFENCVRRY